MVEPTMSKHTDQMENAAVEAKRHYLGDTVRRVQKMNKALAPFLQGLRDEEAEEKIVRKPP
jgi:hypothetical protein